MAEYVIERETPAYAPGVFVARIINTIVGIVETLLALRLVLVLLGASPTAAFVAWLYAVTDALAAPFTGAFPNWYIAGFVVDFSILFAMLGYAIIGWLLVRLVSFIFSRTY